MPNALPEQAYTWSKGKAIYAAGVQFPPVHLDGQTFLPGQANNFYIFPAIGMAVFATQAKRVTDDMFIEAATAVADQVPDDLLKQGCLYPLQVEHPRNRDPNRGARRQAACSIRASPALTAPPTSRRSSAATSTNPTTTSWADGPTKPAGRNATPPEARSEIHRTRRA